MPYVQTSDSLEGRPAWILGNNMNNFVMKNDHRIPWNCLLTAINRAIVSGKEEDIKIVNSLLKMSPSNHRLVMENFKVAINQHKSGQLRKQEHIQALDTVEQLIFSLPTNVANGLNNRADDPGGDDMDFTPDDVDYAGTPTGGVVGNLQILRETLYGLLIAAKPDAKNIDKTCVEIVRAIGHANLNDATPANFDHWHPGPPVGVPPVIVPRTHPGYRYFLKLGVPLSLDEVKTMIKHVTSRAKKRGGAS